MEHQEGNIRTKNRLAHCRIPAGDQSFVLGRAGVSKGAPEKVTSEMKTDTCTAGYQSATESSCFNGTHGRG